jgi:hypothetical protein
MIEKSQVQNLAKNWQTTGDNVVREYFQQLFLSRLYQEKGSEGLFFKGGARLCELFGRARDSREI